MWKTTLAQIRAHGGRLIASCLAIVIAVGFVVATLVLSESANATITRAVGAQYVDTDAVVVPDVGPESPTPSGGSAPGEPSLDELVPRVVELDAVAAVAADAEAFVQALVPGTSGSQYVTVESIAVDEALRWQRLSEGRLPDRAGEVAVSARAGAQVGDTISITFYPAVSSDDPGAIEPGSASAPEPSTEEATVVGVVDLSGDPTAGLRGRYFATPEQVTGWGGTEPTQLRIAANDGADVGDLIESVRSLVDGAGITGTVLTGQEQAAERASSLTGNTIALATFLLIFGSIAVFVAGLVIANTFSVLLAQRTRELALLRCVGATARQVRRGVLGEAAITGFGASALGVGVGIGLAAVVSAIASGVESPIPLGALSIPLYTVLAGLAIGTLVTVLSALAPSKAATRVSPLAALRPMDHAPLRSKRGLVRLAIGLGLFLPGFALMVLGVTIGEILIALPGEMLSALGALLLLQRVIPPVVALAGRLIGGLGGVPAKLAAGNATRNPRRTAATATALLIGVTLTTGLLVGAASTRVTAAADLDRTYPTDVIVATYDQSIPASLADQLRTVENVDSAVALVSTDATASIDGPIQPIQAFGVDLGAAGDTVRAADSLPGPGQVTVNRGLARSQGLAEGDPVTFDHEDNTVTLSAHLVDAYDDLVMSREDLLTLDPEAGTGQIWLRVSDDLTAEQNTEVINEITDLATQAVPSVDVSGLISVRLAVDSILDVLLMVVTGLLGIAVVIALIGVGNTLALSVIERRQENGLMRALGLTRGQLRGLLAWEALLVAGVAAVLGVVAGSVYGLAGAAAVLSETDEVIIDFPVLQVLAVIVVATAAGVLASVLPARRAARTSPVAAMAN
jgi:putative ABC transport system permease protein